MKEETWSEEKIWKEFSFKPRPEFETTEVASFDPWIDKVHSSLSLFLALWLSYLTSCVLSLKLHSIDKHVGFTI